MMAVRPGMTVSARGRLVELSGRRALLLDHKNRGPAQVTSLDVPWLVAVRGIPRSAETGSVIGVVGRWEGKGMVVDATVVTRARDERPAATAATAGLTPEFAPGTLELLAELRRIGVLVSAVTRTVAERAGPREVELVCCVTDLAAADDLVRSVIAPRVRLARSRWTAGQIHSARELYRWVPDNLLCAFGEEHTDDDQLRILLDVTYVTPELERRIGAMPAGLVKVRAFIVPA